MPSPAVIATGTVLAVQVIAGPSWLPRTEFTLASDRGGTLTLVLPGANGGPPAAVIGVPRVEPGQRWHVEADPTPMGLVPRGHGAGMRALGPQPVWNLNGNHLPDEALPWPMALDQEGIPSLGVDRSEAIVEEALAQWSAVGCATFAFAYQGRTDAGFADDGLNVLAWEDELWEWHQDAAGMSVVRFDTSGDVPFIRETDILFNAVDFDWVDEPGSVTVSPIRLHAGSVVVHELGHSTGMDHEFFYVTSSMFYGYVGGDWMATLSGDDQRGLCENYPSGADACATDEDCEGLDASERHCVERDGVFLCDEVRDEPGSACSLSAFNCEEVCAFGTMFYEAGICALTCPEGTCAEGYTCQEQPYTLPLDPGPVCMPVADTGLDSPPADSHVPDDSGGEGDRCGCGTNPGRSAWLPLLLLPFALRSRRRP